MSFIPPSSADDQNYSRAPRLRTTEERVTRYLNNPRLLAQDVYTADVSHDTKRDENPTKEWNSLLQAIVRSATKDQAIRLAHHLSSAHQYRALDVCTRHAIAIAHPADVQCAWLFFLCKVDAYDPNWGSDRSCPWRHLQKTSVSSLRSLSDTPEVHPLLLAVGKLAQRGHVSDALFILKENASHEWLKEAFLTALSKSLDPGGHPAVWSKIWTAMSVHEPPLFALQSSSPPPPPPPARPPSGSSLAAQRAHRLALDAHEAAINNPHTLSGTSTLSDVWCAQVAALLSQYPPSAPKIIKDVFSVQPTGSTPSELAGRFVTNVNLFQQFSGQDHHHPIATTVNAFIRRHITPEKWEKVFLQNRPERNLSPFMVRLLLLAPPTPQMSSVLLEHAPAISALIGTQPQFAAIWQDVHFQAQRILLEQVIQSPSVSAARHRM